MTYQFVCKTSGYSPQKKCEDIPNPDTLGITEKKKCYTIPEIRMDSLPNGGLQLDNKTLLIIDGNSFYASRETTLYGVSYAVTDIPLQERVIDDTTTILDIEDPSTAYAHLLQPTYE